MGILIYVTANPLPDGDEPISFRFGGILALFAAVIWKHYGNAYMILRLSCYEIASLYISAILPPTGMVPEVIVCPYGGMILP
jgi:hypothetical protein